MKSKRLSETELEKDQLISEIYSTIRSLESAHSRFEYITEPDLIDCTIYEMKAIQLKYKFLLKKIKELGMV